MRFLAMLICLSASGAFAETIKSAGYIGPTQHYPHGVLGDTIEYSGMMVELSGGKKFLVDFPPETRVFEDVEPRLWDITGDGQPELVVIETNPPEGAQLAVYAAKNGVVEKIAATPHIGRTHRWLAPIGAADLDGDGYVEVAYIDRPHLAKRLRIWRYKRGKLQHVADFDGLTNHRIGWDFISGGIRDCGDGPEMITASADWSRVIASQLNNGKIRAKDLGPYRNPDDLTQALTCR